MDERKLRSVQIKTASVFLQFCSTFLLLSNMQHRPRRFHPLNSKLSGDIAPTGTISGAFLVVASVSGSHFNNPKTACTLAPAAGSGGTPASLSIATGISELALQCARDGQGSSTEWSRTGASSIGLASAVVKHKNVREFVRPRYHDVRPAFLVEHGQMQVTSSFTPFTSGR